MVSPGCWFNIKMSSYQYRKSHCGDKTILRPSYLHNGISILVRRHLYIESGPRPQWVKESNYCRVSPAINSHLCVSVSARIQAKLNGTAHQLTPHVILRPFSTAGVGGKPQEGTLTPRHAIHQVKRHSLSQIPWADCIVFWCHYNVTTPLRNK